VASALSMTSKIQHPWWLHSSFVSTMITPVIAYAALCRRAYRRLRQKSDYGVPWYR
jgi:hypothetical protein